jgi:hypothetical protein
MMKKYYDIERAAGALAKFPGHKSDLKDFVKIKRTFLKFLIGKMGKLRVTEKIREPRPNI